MAMQRVTSSVPFAKIFEETELFTDLKDKVCLIVQFMRRAELYLLTAQNSSIGDLVTDSLSHQLLILEHTMVDL